MFGLTNAIGNLIGLMGPISTGYILGDDPVSNLSNYILTEMFSLTLT